MSFNKKGEIVCDINSASSSAVQEYTKNLDSLLFSGKEGIDLAKKLFLYSYFKDGVDFTPTSYGKCFSTLFWNKMTTFMNELRNMEEDEDRDYSEYLELFIINHFHENNVIKEKVDMINNRISPIKDVDGFHEHNMGKLVIGNPSYMPCTTLGIMMLLEEYGVKVGGRNCVVVGRSDIVGKPTALALLHDNGTVTVCHSKTVNLKEICIYLVNIFS